jgi:hypothetical protein
MYPPSRIQPPGRRIRWLARRPPETLPAPRRAPSEPGPTPQYENIPRWGLRQDFPPAYAAHAGRAETASVALASVLQGAVVILAIAALAEALAYVLLLVNRAKPVSKYLAWAADVSVFALGWLAVIAMIAVFVAMARWVQAARAEAYAAVGTREPRPQWQLWVYCLVPVVNLFAAPVLALELVRAQDRAVSREPSTDRRVEFIRRWWVGWAALSMVTLGCVAYAQADGGLQHRADAIVYTALTYLFGAGFLVITLRLVRSVDAGPTSGAKVEEGRWLAV